MTLPATRDLLDNERVAAINARVAIHDDRTTHWRVGDEGQILVTVLSHQHEVPIEAIWGGGSLDGRGLWYIPDVGTEVMVTFANDEFEGDAYIARCYGDSPFAEGEENCTLLIGSDRILIRTPGGSTKRLMTVDDGADLKTAIQNTVIVASDGGASFKSTLLSGLTTWPTGTTKTEAE